MKNKILDKRYHDLLDAGIAPSTKKAHEGDVRRFWAYVKTKHHKKEKYPIPVDLILQFILDHADNKNGPTLKVATLKRYLASLSVTQQAHGHPSILANVQVKMLLRRAKRALPNQAPNKKKPITAAILKKLIQTCDRSLHGVRDKAILYLGFASGGRRRSEISNLQVNDIEKTTSGYLITLRQSKTDQEKKGMNVPLTGNAAKALTVWLKKSKIQEGFIFRGIRTNDALNAYPMNGSSISRMVKRRIVLAGLNKKDYSAHSLRSGFMTESINQGVPLLQAMQMTGHSSYDVAAKYFYNTEIENNLAVNLIDDESP